MSTPMLDNLLASYGRPVQSPLYGLSYQEVADKIATVNLSENDSLTGALEFASGQGFKFVELVGPAPWIHGLGTVMDAITLAHDYAGVVVRNPMRTAGPRQIMSHSNVVGIIVSGEGSPAEHDAMRHLARRDGLLPIWFVLTGSDIIKLGMDAEHCADEIQRNGFKGMGVGYIVGDVFYSVLTPIV